MGSICLSSASILRCASLTQLENILLVIPSAVEVIVTTSLIFLNWGKGRRHLLLVAEAWVFLILVLFELFSEIIPAVQMNLLVFRAFDLGIGIASFLPIFFYTFFLFLFASRELADTLPKGLQIVAKLALILFIPAIIIFNEVASFVGVTIRDIPTKKEGQFMTAVGFTSKEQETLWTFFTSLTLAVFTVYQAIFFFFAFFRVIQVLLQQRNIEKEGSDKMHFINGVGWLSGGAKLGAVEMVVGFAGGGFTLSLTRRTLRLVSRVCFTIGVAKGPDILEDFQAVKGEIIYATARRKQFRHSRIHQFISNPRFSTFRQLSPTATAFHSNPRAPSNVYIGEKYNSGSLFLARKPRSRSSSPMVLQSGLPGMEQFVEVKEKDASKRVTVRYSNGTPKLHMRFSPFDLAEPPQFPPDNTMPRPKSAWYDESLSRKSRFTLQSKYSLGEGEAQADLQPPKPKFAQSSRGDSEGSRDSSEISPSVTGSFQIVVGRQRRLSPTTARIYQTPTSTTHTQAAANDEASRPSFSPVLAHNVTPETLAVMAFPEPIRYESPEEAKPAPEESKRDDDYSRHKSMASVKSVPDSIQAVHDLAGQFPGPPGSGLQVPLTAFQRPISEVSDGRSSVLYPPGIMAPQVLGSPSQLLFKDPIQAPYATLERNDKSSSISNNFGHNSSPLRGGRVPVTPNAGRYRISGTPARVKRRGSSIRKTIDPFDDDGSTDPIGQTPRLDSLKQEVPDDITPVTGLSGFPLFQAVPENTPGSERFVDLGMALDTGKSRQFIPVQMGGPQQESMTDSTSPSSRMSAYKDDKFNRIAEWVDTSAAVATPPMEALVEEPERGSSLQNLRSSSADINNTSLPWLQPESERNRARAAAASNPKKITRIKTFGRVANRPTPAPVHVRHTRGSLHLRPIVIPPRTTDMPEAVQIDHIEIGSLESALSPDGRKVLRDSEVLGIEDNDARMRQKAVYF